MPSAQKITALRGMRDVFSAEYARRRAIRAQLEEHLLLHAYLPIELPILENTELYLRKSGEDIASRLYEFDFKSRRIALRPELTASILRAYVEHLQDEPLPLRIQYAGPVFRYEKPQHNRFRQFTVAGAELLGAAGPMADAEILYLACSGLATLGLRKHRLVVGHSEILAGFLTSLGLRRQLLNFLLRNMENVRKRGLDAVIDSLSDLYPDLAGLATAEADSRPADSLKSRQLIDLLREMSDSEAHQAVTDFLHSLNIRIDTNRDQDEVIDRLLHKIREDDQAPKVRTALEYMRKLSDLTGPATEILARARDLFAQYDVNPGALDTLEATILQLGLFGELDADIHLDLGLNRGLHYYTGLMFEIHYPTASGEDIQLCGGGRYDNLVSILGGSEPTPAAGFAYGIERVASVVDAADRPSPNRPDVYVIPVAEGEVACCLRLARDLRARQLVVEVGLDDRNLRRGLKHADRKGVAAVVIVGERERQQGQVLLRDMRNRQELTVPLDDVPDVVTKVLSDDD
ncbi:MAG: HisS family protein [Chloroflexi bacterium]|nr:HisS family protein [Chloroflexota bacterium]